jgi:SpoIIAA-like
VAGAAPATSRHGGTSLRILQQVRKDHGAKRTVHPLSTEGVAMMELIPDLPTNVVGLVASGHITGDDYARVAIPAVEAALKMHGRIRMLYQVPADFDGFAAGAVWDDVRMGMGHFTAWEKIAVVTDVDWIRGSTRLFAFLMPCPVKLFANAELAEATRWIVA